CRRQGDDAAAEPWLREAVEIYRKEGKATRQRIRALLNLGEIHEKRQELAEAEKLYREALDAAYKVNSKAPHLMLGFADRLSALLVARKALAETENLWNGVLAYVKRNKGAETAEAICLRNIAVVRLAAGKVEGYGKMCDQLDKLGAVCILESAWAHSLDTRK